MARLKTLGFELNSTTTDVEYSGNTSPGEISASQHHSGSRSWHTNQTNDFSRGRYIFASSNNNGPFFARAYMYLPSLPTRISGAPFAIGSLSDTNNVVSFKGSGADEKVGQSITAAGTSIDSIDLKLFKTGNPTDNVTISITSGLGGASLGSASIASASIVDGGPNNFHFASPITVTNGGSYFIEVSRSGGRDASNYWSVYIAFTTNPYAGGHLYTSQSGVWQHTANDDSSDMQFGIHYVATETSVLGFGTSSAGGAAYLTIDYSGKLRLRDNADNLIGSPTSALSTGAWHILELKLDVTATTLELRLDGVVVATSSSASCVAVDRFEWGASFIFSEELSTMEVFFDDIAVNDSSGSAQVGYPGPGFTLYLMPDSAGDANSFATANGGTAGAANNFTRVNETTPDDATTYNGSSTLNEEDIFNVGASGLGSTDTINVVEVHARFRNSTADATAALMLQLEKIASGTVGWSAAIVPNSTTFRTNKAGTGNPRTAPIVAYLDPDGIPWQKTSLDSAQIGYKLTTAPGTAGRRIDVTKVWAVVEYVPGTYRASLVGLFD